MTTRKADMVNAITQENFPHLWESITIRATDKYDMPPEVIHINASTISTLGNFSASTGKGKSKKTFNVCAIVAAAMTGRRILCYQAHFPEGKRKVLYFDTEQSSYHCHRVLERINLLAGFPADRDNGLMEFVMLREFSPTDRIRIIELALAAHPDVGLVVIDGLRDLLFDINSSTEAGDVIGLLMRWTSQYNIHIHTVLHLNKGDDNVRGHIGTELNHKAETILQVTRSEKDGTVSEVHASLIRDREFAPFAFRINAEGLPELADDVDIEPRKKRSSFNYELMSEDLHRVALDAAFGEDSTPLGYSAMLERLGRGYSTIGFTRSRNTHVNLLKFLVRNRIICKEGKGYVYNRAFRYTPTPGL